MAINYTRLFTTLGKILGGLEEINTARYTTLFARVDTIDDRFESVFQDQVPDLYSTREQAVTGLDGLTRYYQTLAQRTLVKEVQADNPAIPASVDACLKELVRQMRADGESLENGSLASTPTISFSEGNIGTVPSGYTVNNVLFELFSEDTVRPDVYFLRPSLGSDNGAVAYRETFTVKGNEFPYNRLDARWPDGENISTTVDQVDPFVDEWFTAEDAADGWTAVVANPSTTTATVRGESTTVFTKVVSSGNTIISIEQDAGANMRPNTWYVAYILAQQNSSQPLTVQAQLLTGSGGASYPQMEITASESFTVGDQWETVGVLFRTKEKLPDNPKLRITLTAGGSSVTCQLCYPNMSETKAVELYPLGPAIALLSARYPAVYPNLHTVTVPDQSVFAEMVRGMERLFDASTSLVQGFPTEDAGTATIADSLIS